jgi:hypothetical protein
MAGGARAHRVGEPPYVGLGVPMPSVSVVRDRLITGIARGYSELEWAALGLLAAEEAGLTNKTPKPLTGGSDPELKQFASQTLPKIEDHL